VRAFIERAQPAVCLTGHIHEARAVDRIGQTTVVNPGALSGGGFVKVTLSAEGLRAELLSFS
jgi:Icc-related predicted phosphoesterase